MNIFYLFAGLLMLVCVAGAIGSAGILLIGFLTKNQVRKVSLPLGGFGLCASLLALGLVAGCNHLLWGPTTDPAKAYRLAFHSDPPASVRNLHGIANFGPDSAQCLIQFTTDEATFRSLLPGKLSRKHDENPSPGQPPEWWTPAVTGETEVYLHVRDGTGPNDQSGGPMFEKTFMTLNPKTGLVQYIWSACG